MLEAQEAVQALQDGLGRAGARAIVADEAADDEAVALLHPGLIVLAIGRPRVKWTPWRWHQPRRHALMNSLPLALCHSRNAKGRRWET